MDLVVGLPYRTEACLRGTVAKVLGLGPSRLALYGYAHVPWVSKSQKLIPEDALSRELERYGLACAAAELFLAAGYEAIGIDHFARPDDGPARAGRSFQGYTHDTCATLIGPGASLISRFPTGQVQNATATEVWAGRVQEGGRVGTQGHLISLEKIDSGREPSRS